MVTPKRPSSRICCDDLVREAVVVLQLGRDGDHLVGHEAPDGVDDLLAYVGIRGTGEDGERTRSVMERTLHSLDVDVDLINEKNVSDGGGLDASRPRAGRGRVR